MAKSFLLLLTAFLIISTIESRQFLETSNVEINFPKCFQDLTQVKAELQNFLRQNITIQTALAELQKLKPMLSSLLKDCTIGLEDYEKVSMMGFETNWVQCVTDLANLAPIITKLVLDSIKGDATAIIDDVTSLVNAVGVALKDCFVNPSA